MEKPPTTKTAVATAEDPWQRLADLLRSWLHLRSGRHQ